MACPPPFRALQGILLGLLLLILSLALASGGPPSLATTFHRTLRPRIPSPGSRAPIMRVRDLRAGMRGYGLTVFRGTRVERFPVTVLGVIRSYIGESDLILIRVTGGYPAQHGVGIVAGMSGSPVYVDRRLIGAIAYGWPFSKEPIGGVTPIESMLKDLPADRRARTPGQSAVGTGGPRPLPQPIRTSDRVLRRVQLLSSAPTSTDAFSRDTLVLTPVSSLLQVRGFGSRSWPGLEKILRPLQLEPVRTFATAAPVHQGLPRIVPGSAVGVQLLSGDLEISGTGTMTWMDGERFLAFGHPMSQLGAVSLPLTASYVQDILPSYQRPFKFASQIGVIGELSSDRLWAIGGFLGRSVPMIPVRIHFSDPAQGRDRVYRLKAAQNRLLAPAVLTQAMMEALGSHLPMAAENTAVVRYRIKPVGRAVIEGEQMYSGLGVETTAATNFNDILSQIVNNDFAPLKLENVDVEARILPGRHTARIEQVYTGHRLYHRGDMLDVHVVLKPYGGSSLEKVVQVPVPADLARGPLVVGVAGGGEMVGLRKRLQLPRPEATNVDQLLRQIAAQETNQQLIVRVVFPTQAAVVGEERLGFLPESLRDILPGLPQSSISAEKDFAEVRLPTTWVLRGIETTQTDVSAGSPIGRNPSAPVPATMTRDNEDSQPVSEGRPASPTMVAPLRASPTPVARAATSAPALHPSGAQSTSVVSAGTRRWDLQDRAAFERGTFEGTGLSPAGELTLAPRPRRVLDAAGDFVWALAPDARTGQVLLGTSRGGRVLRLPLQGGTASTAFRVDDAAVTAITTAPDQTTWVGTSPRGRIFRCTRSGEIRCVHDGPETYVWALLPMPDGGVLAATGNPACLYRIPATGRPRLLHRFPERHVRVLARASDTSLLIGTAGPGVVYRMRPDSDPEALFSTRYGSVDGVGAEGSDGVVAVSGKDLYRLRAGQKLNIVAVSDRPLLAMASLPNGDVVTAGGAGRLYQIDSGNAVTRLADFEGGPVTALVSTPTGVLAATSAPGSVSEIDVRLAAQGEGTWTSDVLDAGRPARWGRMRWTLGAGATTPVTIQTRTGYTASPDVSWSPWSAPASASEGQALASPPSRYLQVRVRMPAADAEKSPRLAALSIFYMSEDEAPKLALSRPQGGERVSGSLKVEWKASGSGVEFFSFDVSCSRDGGRTWTSVQRNVVPKLKEQPPGTSVGEPSPQAVECAWDTRRMPDGTYVIKIEASDRSGREDGRAEIWSKPFVVTNSRPEVTILGQERLPSGAVKVRGLARSHLAWVSSVAWRPSGRADWQVARPEGGMYDSDRQRFSFVVAGPGDVEIKVTDEAGNAQVIRASVH